MSDFIELDFPKSRIATFDTVYIGKRKHHMAGFLEFDVTDTLQKIRDYRNREKTQLSFTAWLIKSISFSLEEYPQAHGYLVGKRKIITFKDIDISILIEREFQGAFVPLPYVLRRTNEKSIQEITEEIARAKEKPLGENETVLGESGKNRLQDLYNIFPAFIRRLMWHFILKTPKIANKTMGSVSITPIGMMGSVRGLFLHTSIHPISFGVGSIVKKPGVVGKCIEIRDFLQMTILLDHDVIDGAPMARFVRKLSKRIESGFLLE